MGKRSSEYTINKSKFRVAYGDITKSNAEALVSSDDNYLSMGGGVSAALRQAAGEVIADEARKHVPVELGGVAVTSAGKLPAKFIFHAVTIDYTKMQSASEESVKRATKTCLHLAENLGVQTVAFPALGTGVARFPFKVAAKSMTETIAEHLNGSSSISDVQLMLFAREHVREDDLDMFYEQAVGVAAISTQSKRLLQTLDDLQKLISNLGDPAFAERVSALRHDIKDAHHSWRAEEDLGATDTSGSRIVSLSETLLTDITEAESHSSWNDKELEAEVIRTKLTGLYTQLNVNTSNLNRFQIEKAKHGGHLIPPRLETSILEAQEEIQRNEDDIRELREQLVSLNPPE